MSQFFAAGGQKYWSFSFSISPSSEYSGLISFKIDRLDLPAVQGTLKSLLQHHSSKASIIQCSAFFMVQLSHPYMTTGKTISLTKRTFASKVVSLLFNVLSRFFIVFLSRTKHLLISWLQPPSAVIWSPRKEQTPCQSLHLLFTSLQKWEDSLLRFVKVQRRAAMQMCGPVTEAGAGGEWEGCVFLCRLSACPGPVRKGVYVC